MNTREQHWQQKRRYARVHAILSNPPRKEALDVEAFNRGVDDALTLQPLRSLWRRVWDSLVRTTP